MQNIPNPDEGLNSKSARTLPLQYVKGVGPRRAEALAKEGIVTPYDVVMNVPRGYVNRTAAPSISALFEQCRAPDLWIGDAAQVARVSSEISIVALISDVRQKTVGKGRTMLDVTISDGSASTAQIVFWNNISYYSKLIKEGKTFLVSGVPEYDPKRGQLTIHHPELEEIDADDVEQYRTGATLPKYPLTQGLKAAGVTMRQMRTIVEHVLEQCLSEITEPLPASVLSERSLMPKAEALREIHMPTSLAHVERARYRMKYEELFVFELLLAARRRSRRNPEAGLPMQSRSVSARTLVESLPYTLTGAQRRVIREIVADMTSGLPMNRLLQGDVGSGKTIVALLCMLNAIDNGFQTLIMAPTEILAEQHLHGIRRMLGDSDVRVVQLVGGLKKKERNEALALIASGEAHIVVGTHALFESEVQYHKLGLIVIDEQHRFGVAQRAELRRMGRASHPDGPRTPHILVMSATPIPRTLSMTLYGDLDASVIDEMPANRVPIRTSVVFESQLDGVHEFIRSEVKAGRQAYVVYPLVEKSEKVEAKSAIEHFNLLRETVFSDIRVGLLHGQMNWVEKEATMRAFLEREFDVLVSTTVIEVGIDVSNASIMLVENAERFGLSQLHQLRGRVGRGANQSYCFLATKDHFRYLVNRSSSTDDRAKSIVRLKTMEETTDGFRIAEVDLRLRGPGDVLGVRQSGLPEFRFADLVTDASLIVVTRGDAFALLDSDPHLRLPEHINVKNEVLRLFDGVGFLTGA
ncbi:MAG: ATP-dependent DNA helicase RecG [Candidatus Kapabacteria bacterium]|nr:ATP-dependent DNA helicase RecG [Candidatus Kapabacteria bacterium]